MKIRRIPEIDLARITVLDEETQRSRLRRLRFYKPPHTYKPTRASIPDLLNEEGPLIGSGGPSSWEAIARRIIRASTHEKECHYNLGVAKALHDYCLGNSVVSRRKSIPVWPVGFGHQVAYWWNLYCVLEKRAVVPFIDPRLNSPLTGLARIFAFSLMHERIRVSDPDFADAGLLILQFGKGEQGERVARPHWADGLELFDSGQLNEMITVTYRIWAEVLTEREAAERKTGTDGLPLFRRR